MMVAALAAGAATGCAQPPATTARVGWLIAGDSLARDSLAARAPDTAAVRDSAGGEVAVRSEPARRRFRSEADSLEWDAARGAAERARGFRVVISLFDRRLWAIRGSDTLHVADVGIGMDSTLAWRDTVWEFQTPRGRRAVRGKARNPIWVPPDWHYVEAAAYYGLRLETLHRGRPVTLADGRRLLVRGDRVVVVDSTGTSTPLPVEDEIIFDGVLYVPPFSTRNRRIPGELGPFKLDLGDGYLIHGTPHAGSIGRASTHGCIRLADPDIEWLYENVPVGTRVYIY